MEQQPGYSTRNREIDFLRGIAVVLVLFRHHKFIAFMQDAGWIGVDLFFVLSGFLVSGLLFKEYKLYGNIQPYNFLVRRGLKIYPLFYFALIITIVIEIFLDAHVSKNQILSEAFFLQNYYKALWNHTWSLAVEEHFYFGLTLLVVVLIAVKKLDNAKVFFVVAASIFGACLLLRIYTNLNFPYNHRTHLFPTHLRIDSLFFGVLLSYVYHFNPLLLSQYVKRENYSVLYLIFCLMIAPAFIFKVNSFFMNTIGLTFLYVGFGILLSIFVTDREVNKKMNKVFSETIVNLIAKIGFYSYSIYLFHMFVARYVLPLFIHPLKLNYGINFIIYFVLSIAIGTIVSMVLEKWFLALRDKYFPSRSVDRKARVASSSPIAS